MSTARLGLRDILYARTKGLAGKQSQILSQDTPGVEDEAEPGDGYGATLVAGNLDFRYADDLAIGFPHEDSATTSGVGAVSVLYSSSCDSQPVLELCANGDEFWTLDALGVSGLRLDGFGWALASEHLGSGGADDLAIGIPGWDVEGASGAGAVAVIYGTFTTDGLVSDGSQVWTQDSRE